MATTEDRIRELVRENLDLDRDPNFDASLSDSGVSSVDAIAFMKIVSQEFGVEISPDDLGQIMNLRDLASFNQRTYRLTADDPGGLGHLSRVGQALGMIECQVASYGKGEQHFIEAFVPNLLL